LQLPPAPKNGSESLLIINLVFGISFNKPSPDHSTFSRFIKSLFKEAKDQINSEILRSLKRKA